MRTWLRWCWAWTLWTSPRALPTGSTPSRGSWTSTTCTGTSPIHILYLLLYYNIILPLVFNFFVCICRKSCKKLSREAYCASSWKKRRGEAAFFLLTRRSGKWRFFKACSPRKKMIYNSENWVFPFKQANAEWFKINRFVLVTLLCFTWVHLNFFSFDSV